jgi:hypothetical protein
MIVILKTTGKVAVLLFALIGFLLTSGYIAVITGLTNTLGKVDQQTKKFIYVEHDGSRTYTTFPLAHTPEWIAFRQAIIKDKPIISRISKETGVSERLLVTILVPEQMRLYNSDRALFKSIFAPLKILGSQSQFSWGLFGIKDETARKTEDNLSDPSSPFYLGQKLSKTLAFSTQDHDQERFMRITNEDDHYYSYLYAAIYIKQVETQWEHAGYSITDKPEIVATLWNLGFEKSKPNKDPKSGGAIITIKNTDYSFGELARLFYYSDEMIELFPQ